MEGEVKKKHGHELHLQAVWFAAGTAAFMACLERAVLVSFVEQWRVLVFLSLNLLLLAILFTSTHPNCSPSTDTPETQNGLGSSAEEADQVDKQGSSAGVTKENEAADQVDLKSADMSKEELNERVEAFIAMFRQHLASDAKINFAHNKTRTCRLYSPSIKGSHEILSRRPTAISYATHSGAGMRCG